MIDMKRKLIKIIVALCMTFCLLLVGCGQKTAGNAQDAKNGVAQIFCTVRDENGTLVASDLWSQEAQEADFLLER